MVVRSLSGLWPLPVATVAAGSAVAATGEGCRRRAEAGPGRPSSRSASTTTGSTPSIIDPIPTAVRDALAERRPEWRLPRQARRRRRRRLLCRAAIRAGVDRDGNADASGAAKIIARLGGSRRRRPRRPAPIRRRRSTLARHAKATPGRPGRPADVELARRSSPTPATPMPAAWCPSQVSPNFGYEPHLPDPVAVLTTVAVGSRPGRRPWPHQSAAARVRRPSRQARRAAAKAAEAAVRAGPVPAGPTLKPGMSDPRVPVLRARLDLSADAADPDLYDDALVAAVKAFQKSARSAARRHRRQAHARSAQRRRRSMHEFPSSSPTWSAGAGCRATSARSTSASTSPTSTSTSIRDGAVDLQHPHRRRQGHQPDADLLRRDREHHRQSELERAGLDRAEGDAAGDPANPASLRLRGVRPRQRPLPRWSTRTSIDWQNVDIRKIQIRQPPGERNALGKIKFMFPNQYDVYLHDTPSKSLFQRDYRAFSHGCMRVDGPDGISPTCCWPTRRTGPGTSAMLKKLIGGAETLVDLSRSHPGAHHLLHRLGRRERAIFRLRPTTSTATTRRRRGGAWSLTEISEFNLS